MPQLPSKTCGTGFQPVNLFTDKPRPRKLRADSWTPDEVRFADAAITAWNKAFAGKPYGHRASTVRHNRYAVISFYRRNCEAAPGEPQYSLEEVSAAIAAYATDPALVKSNVFCYFANWFANAEERIDHQLRRVGATRPCGTGFQPVDLSPADAATAATIKRDFAGLIQHCEKAAADGVTPLARAERFVGLHSTPEPTRHAFQRLIAICNGFYALSGGLQTPLRTRARGLFPAVFAKPLDGHKLDRPRLDALQLALFDLDSRTTNKETAP